MRVCHHTADGQDYPGLHICFQEDPNDPDSQGGWASCEDFCAGSMVPSSRCTTPAPDAGGSEGGADGAEGEGDGKAQLAALYDSEVCPPNSENSQGTTYPGWIFPSRPDAAQNKTAFYVPLKEDIGKILPAEHVPRQCNLTSDPPSSPYPTRSGAVRSDVCVYDLTTVQAGQGGVGG